MVIIRILISFFSYIFRFFRKQSEIAGNPLEAKTRLSLRNDPFQLIFIVLIEKSFWIEKLWIRGDSE